MEEVIRTLRVLGMRYFTVGDLVGSPQYTVDRPGNYRSVKRIEETFETTNGRGHRTTRGSSIEALVWALSFDKEHVFNHGMSWLLIGFGTKDFMFSVEIRRMGREENIDLLVSVDTKTGKMLLQWLYGEMPVEILFDYLIEEYGS